MDGVLSVQVFHDMGSQPHKTRLTLPQSQGSLYCRCGKPQVTFIYNSQDQAQHSSGLIVIGQVDLGAEEQDHGQAK